MLQNPIALFVLSFSQWCSCTALCWQANVLLPCTPSAEHLNSSSCILTNSQVRKAQIRIFYIYWCHMIYIHIIHIVVAAHVWFQNESFCESIVSHCCQWCIVPIDISIVLPRIINFFLVWFNNFCGLNSTILPFVKIIVQVCQMSDKSCFHKDLSWIWKYSTWNGFSIGVYSNTFFIHILWRSGTHFATDMKGSSGVKISRWVSIWL